MYFFIFETTMRISRSKAWDSVTGGGAITCAVDEAEAVAEAPADATADVETVTAARGAGATLVARRGVVGASERCVGAVPASLRLASHSARVGARSSTAQASRWRNVARCESQQATEQNTSCMRARLQVETLHAQYTDWKGMSLRQALQCNQTWSLAGARLLAGPG